MGNFLDLLCRHWEVLFSGIGVAIITLIIKFFFRKNRVEVNQSIQSGDGSVNVQSGGNAEIKVDAKQQEEK